MYKLHSIKWGNFKSWRGDHEFVLPDVPGLYCLTGENQFEPKLGSNGSGKSTLLDTIYWCYFGRTPRGLRAGEIVNRDEKSAYVEVDQTIGTRRFSIRRTQSPNNLVLIEGGKKTIVDQIELQQWLRFNPESFTYAVMFYQDVAKGRSFFDLKPEAKLTLFSQIMELDFWLEKSDAAAKEVKWYEAKIQTEREATISLTATIDATKANIQTLKKNFADHEAAEVDRTVALRNKVSDLIKEKATTQDNVAGIITASTKAAALIGKIKTELLELDEEHDTLSSKLTKHISHRDVEQSKRDRLTHDLRSMEGLGATCSVCKQKIDAKHVRLERDRLKKEISESDIEIAAAKKAVDKAHSVISDVIRDRNAARDDLNKAEGAALSLRRSLTDAQAAVRDIDHAIDAQNERINEKVENPYRKLLAVQEVNLERYHDKMSSLAGEINEMEYELGSIEPWVLGFKRIRLFIIEQSLRDLELEVNNCLASLGLVGWQIEFDVEKEKKTGGVTKGFTVFIRGPKDKEAVRWESFSGGETQRLRQAGDFGLANLILAQAGLMSTIEFFDEPTQHMSQEGWNDLADTLHQRALLEKKTIWMIDHNIPDFGDFAETIKVIKDDNGSRFET